MSQSTFTDTQPSPNHFPPDSTKLTKPLSIYRIQEHLLHSLNSNHSNWPTAVQNHALSLLRSGEITTFPALLRRVIEDVRQDTALGPNPNKAVNGGTSSSEEGSTVNGKKTDGGTNGNANNGVASNRPSLAVPQSVVEEALKVTRESLDTVCEMDDSGTT
jgi:hypothetical protein